MITFQVRREQNLFVTHFEKVRERLVRSFGVAVFNTANKMRVRDQENIRASGRFSSRWTRDLTVQVLPARIGATAYRINTFFATIPYAHIHEFGGVIRGKPSLFNRSGLLWIPLSFAHIPKGMTAQEFGATRGGLFRVNRKSGRPLLLSKVDHKPKYFGIGSVTLRPRFQLRRIGREAVVEFRTELSKAFSATAAGGLNGR